MVSGPDNAADAYLRQAGPFFSNLLDFTPLFDAAQHLLNPGPVKAHHDLAAGRDDGNTPGP